VEHLPRGKDDPERRKPDISKMRDRFGWEPRVGLDEGLAKTIEYFRSMRPAARAR
jgi:nucleoside-diphosphate-sugar epimerase